MGNRKSEMGRAGPTRSDACFPISDFPFPISRSAVHHMSIKPFQFLELPRKLPRAQPIELRVANWHEVHGAFAGEEASDQAGRCIDCGNPWCEWKCPLHNR